MNMMLNWLVSCLARLVAVVCCIQDPEDKTHKFALYQLNEVAFVCMSA